MSDRNTRQSSQRRASGGGSRKSSGNLSTLMRNAQAKNKGAPIDNKSAAAGEGAQARRDELEEEEDHR